LAGVNNHTWTGAWGTVSYWNAYVGNLEMHGKRTFFDPRLDDAEKYPVAARTKQGHKQDAGDRITAKHPALHFYQLALPTPKAPAGVFDRAAAKREEKIFLQKRRAQPAMCHPFSLNRDGTSTRLRRSASTTFRPCDLRMVSTALHHCEPYGTARKFTKADFITTGASQRSRT
jgi:hypothetical protein